MIINDLTVLAEVTEALAHYEAALAANDIATLDALFWRSPLALRYGVGENLYGHDAIAAFRTQRPGGAPPRTVLRTVVTTFGRDFATANIEFARAGVAQIGRQSHSWVRFAEGWRIVAAHVSIIAVAGTTPTPPGSR
jgi:hypothetical protein